MTEREKAIERGAAAIYKKWCEHMEKIGLHLHHWSMLDDDAKKFWRALSSAALDAARLEI